MILSRLCLPVCLPDKLLSILSCLPACLLHLSAAFTKNQNRRGGTRLSGCRLSSHHRLTHAPLKHVGGAAASFQRPEPTRLRARAARARPQGLAHRWPDELGHVVVGLQGDRLVQPNSQSLERLSEPGVDGGGGAGVLSPGVCRRSAWRFAGHRRHLEQ